MIDDGYIKFSYNLIEGEQLNLKDIDDINYYRNLLFEKNFIGMKNGIGFGNISKRCDDSSFIITGTKTGGINNLKYSDYVKVVVWDFKKNHIKAIGKTAPSSESLTHAIFYDLNKSINVVVHIHNSILWEKYKYILPTSSEKAEFGTIDLVDEINFLYLHSDLKEKRILITAGHKDGIFIFADSFEKAFFLINKKII